MLAAEKTLVPTAENESEYRHIEVLEEEEDGENEEVDGEERDKENEQRQRGERREKTDNKIKVKVNGKAMTEFKCTLCGQTYKNFYAKAVKCHDEERGGVCPLKKCLKKASLFPKRNRW